MISLLRHINWRLKGIKVFALVGESGTGKSFRAKLVTEKYGIELLIDDGLLIKNKKILSGKSAKKEKSYLAAIKTALFHNKLHRLEVKTRLKKEKFKRILLIGTSTGMVKMIASRLDLPPISKMIKIEEIAKKEEIQTAIRIRKIEGKHVIPVPAIEIKRNYPHIFYDSIKIFLKNKFSFSKKGKVFEKAIVRPDFSRKGKISISEAALSQMILHCISEYNQKIKATKIVVKNTARGYKITILVDIPLKSQMSSEIHALQEYTLRNVEQYTGIIISEMNIIIDNLL